MTSAIDLVCYMIRPSSALVDLACEPAVAEFSLLVEVVVARLYCLRSNRPGECRSAAGRRLVVLDEI